MRLTSFEIDRFRTFATRTKIEFSEMSLLVGPNNEGKTSACDALEIFFHAAGCVVPSRRYVQNLRFRRPRARYIPTRDYPVALTGARGRRWPSQFCASFETTDADKAELKQLGIVLGASEQLKLNLTWNYQREKLVFGYRDLSAENVQTLVDFIASRFRVIIVPPVRDEGTLHENLRLLFDETVSAKFETSRKIQQAKNNLQKLIEPEVAKMAKALENSCRSLLSDVRTVDLRWDIDLAHSVGVRQVFVDDGVRTSIELKGDGIKNLIVLAQLTNLATSATVGGSDISRFFVVEEPESHLNSAFLYRIKSGLHELSRGNQVLITTHSPVFVEFSKRQCINLVARGQIKRPVNKTQIADALGVRLQENLRSNDVAIICEGIEDEIALKLLLTKNGSPDLVQRIDILAAHGAGNVPITFLNTRNFYQTIYFLLDNDEAGSKAIDELKKLDVPEKYFWICPKEPNRKSAELEDLLDLEFTLKTLSDLYGRNFPLDGATAMRSRYRTKFGDWILPFVNGFGLPISDKDALKRTLWDGLARAEKFHLTAAGNAFLSSIIESAERSFQQ